MNINTESLVLSRYPGRRRKRRGDKLPPFVPLIWDILNSKAYKDLPASVAKALPYFLGKIKISFNDPQRYSTEFNFSYPEAHKKGFAKGTFSGVLKDLIAKGFIDPVDKGGLKGYHKGYNVFTLSERWKNYGALEFKSIDWRCFQPREKIVKVSQKSEPYRFKFRTKSNKNDIDSSEIGLVKTVMP